ncbi:hypothetical protein [Nannocystis punicea]|uniref:Lipoprotein n=1 Tax=Nannocystis punicea TaxID=2995304 RepID=A0ABY7HC42_9BACT|nr:hypothetical protein [Nannocystis poenicansa]WAS96766.1 hypothetical protein O0S08_11505 [Nannocystis poenicansa]
MRSSNLSWLSSSLLLLVNCGEPAARATVATETTSVAPAVEAKAVQEERGAQPAADEAVAAEPEAGKAEEDEVVPRAPAPATAEEAARQMATWLAERDAPVPALLDDESEIEVVMNCGTCDGTEPGKSAKAVGFDALIALDRSLRKGAILGLWDFGDQIECKQGCCRFLIDPEVGLQEHVLGLKKVCVRIDAAGKPIDYTRIEGVGGHPGAEFK